MPADGYDVAVVGLGPVGLLLALLLGRRGVRVLALDRAAEPYASPRAVATDDEVLRILRALPDGAAIVEGMLLDLPVLFTGADGRRITELRFPGAGPGLPGLATFHQPTLEGQLEQRLRRTPTVEIHRGVEVVALTQDPTGVTVRTGAASVRVGWVVGCDGTGSLVRRAVGVGLRGRRYGEPWLVVDSTDEPSQPGVHFSCLPGRPTVDLAVPGGRRREFLLRAEEVDGATARLPALLAAVGVPGAEVQVYRSAVYRFAARSADRWRVGRVLLAGDAAHQMPPFAGQGLSAGLRDAAALAWRLELVVRRGAADHLLDGYQRERVPHVRAMTRLARFAGSVVQTAHPGRAVARDGLLRAADRAPVVGPWLRSGGPRPPARLPRSAHRGGAGRLLPAEFDALLGGGHTILAADDPLGVLTPRVAAGWRAVATVAAPCPSVPAFDGHVLVVRPDRYVAARVPSAEWPQVAAGLLTRIVPDRGA